MPHRFPPLAPPEPSAKIPAQIIAALPVTEWLLLGLIGLALLLC